MARENHNGNGDRREAALLKHLREASEKLSSLKQMLTTSLTMRNVDKRNALLNKALQELKRCEKAVGDLFDEGAEWERKFAGLEGACTAGPGLDRETVARLYWACKRFFETGFPALVSVQESVQQCDHCRRAIDLPYAILGTNLKRMRDVLQDTGASMPDLFLAVNETHGQA